MIYEDQQKAFNAGWQAHADFVVLVIDKAERKGSKQIAFEHYIKEAASAPPT